MNKVEFFKWCEDRNLSKNIEIANLFRLSSQTVRNWRKKSDTAEFPLWVGLTCLALDSDNQRKNADSIGAMTVGELSAWKRKHAFKTLDDTAGVFGIERQAVHNWYKRNRFPRWLSLACLGYDVKNGAKVAK